MRLAIVDLECSDLKSDKGFILCCGVKPLGPSARGGGGRTFSLKQFPVVRERHQIDSALVRAVKSALEAYDGWVTWNGLLFDLPFLDDRLLVAGAPPLEKRFARGLDMMYHAKLGKSALSSARLDSVARALRCPIEKTPLDLTTWKAAEAEAIRGFRDGSRAFDQIVHHCRIDLDVTEWVAHKLFPRVQTISRR
jgi:uncharacterized protein YprB with RNaseH-like and TPR domain